VALQHCRRLCNDGGERSGQTSAEIARIKELERENRELRPANEILSKGKPVEAPLVQAHWRRPICRTLQFAPSTYYDRRAILRHPDLASARTKSDAALSLKIDAAWDANRKLYGARKIWHVLRRQGEDAAPLSANACIRLPGNGCTVERLMRRLGIRGVVRGKKVITTNPDTYVPTWSGTVYVAPRHWARTNGAFHGSIIDVFAWRIVGWRASTSMKTQFVLDALEQAI
jgi:putative transposase